MADTVFDPSSKDFTDQALGRLQQLSSERQNYVDLLNQGTQDFANAAQTANNVIENLNAKAVDEGAKLSKALKDLEEIQTYPRIVQNIGRILGIDSINPDLAETRAQTSAQNIRVIAQQEENTVRAHQISTEMIKQRVAIAGQKYAVQRAEFTDMASAMQMALSAQELRDKKLIDEMNGMDLPQMKKAYDDISAGNTKGYSQTLVNNVGALQRTMTQAQQQQNSATLQNQQIDLGQLAIAEKQRGETLLKYSQKQLIDMVNSGKMADGLTPEQATQEIQRRQAVDLSLQNSRNAVSVGNKQVADMNRADAIKNMTLTEVDKLRQMAKGGNTVVDGIRYSEEELKAAYDKKLVNLQQDKATQAKMASVQAATNLQYNKIQVTKQRLENLTQTAGERDAELISMTANFENQINTALQQGSPLYAQALVQKYNAEIDKLVEKRKKSYPTEYQPGVQEYIDTGKIENAGNAAAILNSMTKDQFAITNNDWDGLWKKFSATSTQLANNEAYSKMMFGTDKNAKSGQDFSIMKMKKTDPELHIRNVVDQSNLIQDFGDVELQNLLQIAAMQGRQQEDQVGAVSTVYSHMVDRNGNLQSRFYGQDENGNLVWEPQKLFEYLNKETKLAQEKGILKDNESYGQELVTTMHNIMRTPNFANRYEPKSVQEAAFLQIFGPAPIQRTRARMNSFARDLTNYEINRGNEYMTPKETTKAYLQGGGVDVTGETPGPAFDMKAPIVEDFFKLFGQGSK